MDIVWPALPDDLITSLSLKVALYTPLLLKLCGVLCFGLLLTALLVRLSRALLARRSLDAALDRLGLASSLQRLGLGALDARLPGLLRFLGLFVTLYLVADLLRISALSRAMGALIAALPALLTALAILLCGVLLSSLVARLARRLLSRQDAPSELTELMPRVLQAVVIVLATTTAAQQLGLDISLIHGVILITVSAITLGVLGAVGLGGVPIFGQLVSRYHAARLFQIDDTLEVDGMRGRLARFGPTLAVLEVASSQGEDEDEEGAVTRYLIPYQRLLLADVTRQRHTVERR